MKKSVHSEEQIAFALKHAEASALVAEVIRQMGVSEQSRPHTALGWLTPARPETRIMPG